MNAFIVGSNDDWESCFPTSTEYKLIMHFSFTSSFDASYNNNKHYHFLRKFVIWHKYAIKVKVYFKFFYLSEMNVNVCP